MKIFLLGKSGYVGSWIWDHFSDKGVEVEEIKVDVTDRTKVEEALKDVSGAVVINATGKTGKPNVDWCEDHRLETVQVNVEGALNVCETAIKQGNYVIQIGSGCIFEGDDSYAFTEEDEPNFFGSFYSQTKAVIEGALKELPNVCVLRIRMPLQGSPHPKNLLSKLLKYDKILNLPNSVTVMEDLMIFLEKVLEKRPQGALNAVNPGVYRHSDLLEIYRKMTGLGREFEYIGADEFEGMTKAKRSNCVLSTALTEELGIAMPPIQQRLEGLVHEYVTKP